MQYKMDFQGQGRRRSQPRLFAAGMLGFAILAGCNRQAAPQTAVAVVNPPAPATPQPAPPSAPTVVTMEDEYVYYPEYEVYYSSNRRQYVYRDGSAWVACPAPPRVSVNVLFASPSVRMDFHDAPERHHDTVIHSYPRGWAPPGRGHDDGDDHRDRGNDDKRDRR